MICKCNNIMCIQLHDEYIELYWCPVCSLIAVRNIELVEQITYYQEVEKN